MEKEALAFLKKEFNLAADKSVIDKDGKIFIDREMQPWHENTLAKNSIQTATLDSLVAYIRAGADGRTTRLFIHIENPRSVKLLGELNEYGEREELMHVQPTNDLFAFGDWYDQESLIIGIQSGFVKSEAKDELLKFVGNLKEDAVRTSADDGVTQTTAVRQGVVSVAEEAVPNPINLKPYRTFPEVDQPESEFVFRLHSGMRAALFEADNNAWKITAIKNIGEYLNEKLQDAKQITILA